MAKIIGKMKIVILTNITILLEGMNLFAKLDLLLKKMSIVSPAEKQKNQGVTKNHRE